MTCRVLGPLLLGLMLGLLVRETGPARAALGGTLSWVVPWLLQLWAAAGLITLAGSNLIFAVVAEFQGDRWSAKVTQPCSVTPPFGCFLDFGG